MRALHSLSCMKDGQQRARRHRAEPAAVNFSSTSPELEQHAPGKGELVLLGNESTTSGYLALPSETKKCRSLSGEVALTPQQRFRTNDWLMTLLELAQGVDGDTSKSMEIRARVDGGFLQICERDGGYDGGKTYTMEQPPADVNDACLHPGESPHPLLQRRLAAGASVDATATFRSLVAGAMHALVTDHVAYLELARAAWCALASPSRPPACDWLCGQQAFCNDQPTKLVTEKEGIPDGWEGMVRGVGSNTLPPPALWPLRAASAHGRPPPASVRPSRAPPGTPDSRFVWNARLPLHLERSSPRRPSFARRRATTWCSEAADRWTMSA